jgi:hypothetical protein
MTNTITPGQALDLLPSLFEKIDRLEAVVLSVVKSGQVPYWLNLSEACELKGIPYGSIKNFPEKQPGAGWADGMNGTRKIWKRDTVLEWLDVSDTNRAEYLASCRERRKK